MTALNAGTSPLPVTLDWDGSTAMDGVTGQRFLSVNGKVRLTLPPLDGVILV